MRALIPRILLSMFSVLALLFVLEAVLRARAFIADRKSAEAWERIQQARLPPKGEDVGLGQSIRISADPRMVYEFIPGMSVMFRGKPLRTDANGFRVIPRNRSREKPRVRLVGLGDSFMFGWDVQDRECYMALLADKLNAERPSCSWDAVNTAVPGYNTVMQVASFKQKALHLQPDIVLVHFVVNDLEMPNFMVEHTPVFSLRRSFLRDYVSKGFRFMHRGTHRLERAPDELRDNAQGNLEAVPPAYRGMVGLAPWQKAMRELKRLAEAHGSALYVLADLTAPPFVRKTCAELELPLIETQEAVAAYLREKGGQDYLRSELVQAPNDTHPSPAGHRLIAGEVFRHWKSDGLLDRLERTGIGASTGL